MKKSREKEVKGEKSEPEAVKVEFFYLKTDEPEEFINELEQLCKKYCHPKNFSFKYSLED